MLGRPVLLALSLMQLGAGQPSASDAVRSKTLDPSVAELIACLYATAEQMVPSSSDSTDALATVIEMRCSDDESRRAAAPDAVSRLKDEAAIQARDRALVLERRELLSWIASSRA
jgi:hypothetical protein